jgi:Na+/melibiose symporter-like transporter
MENLIFLVFLLALVVGIPAAFYGALQVITPEPSQRRDLDHERRFGQFTLGQILVIVVVLALVFAAATTGAPGFQRILPIFLLSLIVLTWFCRAWRHEFVLLMEKGDGDFPGRFDKLIWVLILLFLAPIGVWFFRSFRLAHWPEPKPRADFDAIPTGSRVPEPT